MLKVSNSYKQMMAEKFKGQAYMNVSIGVINQEAQKDSYVGASALESNADCHYLSGTSLLFQDYDVELEYATYERGWWKLDGSMVFPPRENEVEFLYNQGAISTNIGNSLYIRFGQPYDIRGLTIDFSRNYPVDFNVYGYLSDVEQSRIEITNNTLRNWQTDYIFGYVDMLIIKPITMLSVQDRMRVYKILMGVGINFDTKKITKATKTDFVSPISEELPTSDFTLTIENYGRTWDVENKTSAINYLEIGQEVSIKYGRELNNSIVWLDGGVLNLSSWKADDSSMSFTAKDKLDDLNDTYYRGLYRKDGINLYDLAVDVITDAGIEERDYDFDEYLKDVIVHNPLPASTHKECLQLIANAARGKIYCDRWGVIRIDPAFETVLSPERMSISSDTASIWSDLISVINEEVQYEYADYSKNHFLLDGTMYFLPSGGSYLTTGYISDECSDDNGIFTINPSFTIKLEASTTYFGIYISFFANPPKEMILHTYYEGELKESYTVYDLELENDIEHEFSLFDELKVEFSKAKPNSRVYVSSFKFGSITDYKFNYSQMTKSPMGIQEDRTKRVDVIQDIYYESDEIKSIAQETVNLTGLDTYTLYMSEASYDLTASCDGTNLTILDSSNYFVTVDVSSLSGEKEIIVEGRSYIVRNKTTSVTLNPSGEIVTWENPLISNDNLADLQSEWLGNYYSNNIDYSISYRGEPRLDASDLAYLENKYNENLMIQIYEHKISYNGGLSGSAKARRAMNGV